MTKGISQPLAVLGEVKHTRICNGAPRKTLDTKGSSELPWLAILCVYYHIWLLAGGAAVHDSMGERMQEALPLDPSWTPLYVSLPWLILICIFLLE